MGAKVKFSVDEQRFYKTRGNGDCAMPKAGDVFRRCRWHSANFSFCADARLPPRSFFLDEDSRHERVRGCGWKFAWILHGSFAECAANFDRIPSGHGAECRSV